MAVWVPDASVLRDGRLRSLVSDHPGVELRIARQTIQDLRAEANAGHEAGAAGLAELVALRAEANVQVVDGDVWRLAEEGDLVTSDRLCEETALALGLRVQFLGTKTGLEELEVWKYFDDDTMSVHLRTGMDVMIKRGRPGEVEYTSIAGPPTAGQMRDIIRECVEAGQRMEGSFVEMEKPGCTVLQLGSMRITIARPPFSDALELTAVRPVAKTTLDDYELPPEIIGRIEGSSRGVFVAGAPGSGKSTFVAAVGHHLHGLGRVVKTMEQPRDLQVPNGVTQYGALDGDMKWTGEVMLLVRPDHVLYDEVRTTGDFQVFADMRMAGVGLFGVTHASRPIDAVQRLIGRVDLGVIPQVVDTILFIDNGKVGTILELFFTVKVPQGMMEQDLARPVVLVKDVMTGRDLFELYTYGEQVVVMPLDDITAPQPGVPVETVERAIRKYVRGPMEVEVVGKRATVMVAQEEVPSVIGKGGRTVQALEQRLGVRLDIKALQKGKPRPGGVRRSGNNVFVFVDTKFSGRIVRVQAEGAIIGEGTVSRDGKLRFKAASAEGQAIQAADKAGYEVSVDLI